MIHLCSILTSSSGLENTFPKGLLGVFNMIALVFLLNELASSTGSNFQDAEDSSVGSVGFRATKTGVPPASFTKGS